MATSGGYTPAQIPECAYAPQMTRAQALARQTAGTLNPNCVVIITDGPVIGTAGNTSPTQIELQPVSTTELGMSALVYTNFHPNAWEGLYDISLGTAGSIQRLTDHWDNVAQDADADAPTVHTQVPWHKGSNTFRDNFFDDADLPGWAAAGGTIRDNHVQESTVDLTGMATGQFQNNRIIGSTFTSRPANVLSVGNTLTGTTVSHLGSNASWGFIQNTMTGGRFSVNAASAAHLSFSDNTVSGSNGGFRVDVVNKPASEVNIAGNRLYNQSNGANDLLIDGTSDVTFYNNTVSTDSVDPSLIHLGSTAATNLTPATRIESCILNSATITAAGSGRFWIFRASIGSQSSITSAAPSTRGLVVDGALMNGSSVTQSGTGGANIDTFTAATGTTLQRATVALAATAGATPATALSGLVATAGATVNVNDHTAATVIDNCRVDGGSTLTVSGGGSLARSQLRADATLTAQHPVVSSVIEGSFAKTTGAANTGSLCSAAYDNWV